MGGEAEEAIQGVNEEFYSPKRMNPPEYTGSASRSLQSFPRTLPPPSPPHPGYRLAHVYKERGFRYIYLLFCVSHIDSYKLSAFGREDKQKPASPEGICTQH